MPEVPDVLDLSAPQARVLGCLIEKQATTPETYPITLKALTTACNQSSNRHPVVDYEATLVEATVHALKSKGLARVVHPARGERATKYRHVVDEALDLGSAERSLISTLLLRGTQTVAEMRTRSARMHQFSSTADVEALLRDMAERDRPLVAPVERQSGQKEQRWIQLLEADPEGRALAAPAAAAVTARSASTGGGPVEDLTARVAALEEAVSMLTEALGDLITLPEE